MRSLEDAQQLLRACFPACRVEACSFATGHNQWNQHPFLPFALGANLFQAAGMMRGRGVPCPLGAQPAHPPTTSRAIMTFRANDTLALRAR